MELEKEILKLAENAKQTHENLQTQFAEHQKATKEALEQIDVKGTVDPLLAEMQERIAADMLKHQEALDAVAMKMNRPQFGIDSYDDADKKHQEALLFFKNSGKARAQGRGNVYVGNELVIEKGRANVEVFELYKEAFAEHLRTPDIRQLSPEHAKALSVGSDPDGGYTVTPEMSNRIIERQFEMSPMRQVATVENINSMSYQILTSPEEFSAARTAERATNGNTATGSVGREEIVAHMMEARPLVSQEMLEDSMWNVEQYVANKIGKKFARVEANEFINGTGVGQARGITTYTAGTAWGQIEQITSGANGGITYAQLAAIATSLKEGYYANAQWLLHRTLIGKVLALSGNDTPLWIPSIAVGQPSTLLGYPVRFAQDFTTPATDSLSGAFGDFRAGYTWVDRRGTRINPDPYSSKPDIEYYATARSGGAVVDTDAIKVIKLSA